MLLSTISFIYFFILFKYRKSPTPKSILLEAKESLEGLKYNIDVLGGGGGGGGYRGGGGGGGGTQGEEIGMSTVQNGVIL